MIVLKRKMATNRGLIKSVIITWNYRQHTMSCIRLENDIMSQILVQEEMWSKKVI